MPRGARRKGRKNDEEAYGPAFGGGPAAVAGRQRRQAQRRGEQKNDEDAVHVRAPKESEIIIRTDGARFCSSYRLLMCDCACDGDILYEMTRKRLSLVPISIK